MERFWAWIHSQLHRLFSYPHLPTVSTWRSLIPEAGLDYEILNEHSGWNALIDLTTLQPTDQATITVEIEIFGPNLDQVRWEITEEHRIGFRSLPDRVYLLSNDTPVGVQKIVAISPLKGPWRARLKYRQTSGLNKPVRFYIWR